MSTKIREWTVRLDGLPALAQDLKNILTKEGPKPFILWLVGDLGAGKTTLAGNLLHALGVPDSVPVLSPTFTYLTEYDAPIGKIAHMDLYRLVEGDVDSLESLLSGRIYRGIVVEWPERAADSPLIEKTHEVKLFSGDNDDCRRVELWA